MNNPLASKLVKQCAQHTHNETLHAVQGLAQALQCLQPAQAGAAAATKPGGGTKGSAVKASPPAIKAPLGTAEKRQPRSGNNKDPEQQAQAAGLVSGITMQWTHQAQGHAALHAVAQVSFCFGLKRDRSTKWPPLQKQRRKALRNTQNSEGRLTSRSTTSWSYAEAPRLRPPEKEAAAATLLRPRNPCDKLQHPAGQAS